MANDLNLAIRISADGSTALTGLNRVQNGVDSLQRSLTSLAQVAGVAFGAHEVIQAADEYGTLSARIKIATDSTDDMREAQQGLFDISQRTRTALDASVSTFSRLAPGFKALNAPLQDQLQFVETLNKAYKVSGSTQAEATGSMVQLAQALGAGALRGEEFNSVNEAGGRIMQAVADYLGVQRGELKALAEQGVLTSDLVFRALNAQAAKISTEFEELPVTVEDAVVRLKNAFTKIIGEANAGAGGTAAMAEAIGLLADHLAEVAEVAVGAGAALASVWAGKTAAALAANTAAMANNVRQHVAAQAATRALAVEETNAAAAALAQARAQSAVTAATLAEAQAHRANIAALTIYGPMRAAAERQYATAAAAHVAASSAVAAAEARVVASNAAMAASSGITATAMGGLRAAMAALGGPIGLVITLLTAGSAAWLLYGDRAESAAQKAKRARQSLAEQADDILDKLKKENEYGEGNLGILRQQAEALEKEISNLVQSSGASEGARKKLEEKRRELEKTQAGIVELEKREAALGKTAEAAGKSQVQAQKDAKKAVEETKDALKDSIKDYEKLGDALRDSVKDSIKSVDDFRKKAADLRREASKPNLAGLDQSEIFRRSAGAVIELIAALDDLERMAASTDASLADTEKQYTATDAAVQSLRDLAEATDDAQRKAELNASADHYAAQAKLALADAYDREAEREQQRVAALNKEIDANNQRVDSLKALLALVEGEKDLTVQANVAGAIASLEEVRLNLAGIQDKTVTVTTVQRTITEGGAPAPGFALGGLIRGPGTGTSDSILARISNGEYIIRQAAVRRWGVGFLDAVNNLQLPRFALGGLVGGVPSSPGRSSTLQPITLVLPGIGSFAMHAAPDEANNMRRTVSRAALKRGR